MLGTHVTSVCFVRNDLEQAAVILTPFLSSPGAQMWPFSPVFPPSHCQYTVHDH